MEQKPYHDTIDELLSLNVSQRSDAASLLFQRRRRSRPHVLHCHDMMGGYVEDQLLIPYAFQYWDLIDLFVYFSHHCITCPPTTWIHDAHRHNVPILGTLIFEWDQGQIELLCFLQHPRYCIAQLIALSCAWGFDGWLLNIESSVPLQHMDNLKAALELFVAEAHQAGLVLIWYDSISSKTGKVHYACTLDDDNLFFFHLFDGIFLDYHWEPQHLEKALNVAGDRSCDVFAGTDVFGRGTYGGGGFHTYRGVGIASQLRLSSALFAPAWTLECCEVPHMVMFLFREACLWEGVQYSCTLLTAWTALGSSEYVLEHIIGSNSSMLLSYEFMEHDSVPLPRLSALCCGTQIPTQTIRRDGTVFMIVSIPNPAHSNAQIKISLCTTVAAPLSPIHLFQQTTTTIGVAGVVSSWRRSAGG